MGLPWWIWAGRHTMLTEEMELHNNLGYDDDTALDCLELDQALQDSETVDLGDKCNVIALFVGEDTPTLKGSRFCDFGSIADCSKHDFLGRGLILWCKPVPVPNMLPGGSAADIRVKPSDSRVADIHPRGQLIASFTFLEQRKYLSLCFTGLIYGRGNCTEEVPYTVEGHITWYLRFSHVITTWSGWIWC